MDALDPHKRDDSIVSKRPLLVETSSDKSEAESLVFRLPTELTIQIFREYGSDIRLRLTLTHVCHRWRQIAVNDASLWTNIDIDTFSRNLNARLDHFLSFLRMQLDRTANLLLDVEWIAYIGDASFIPTLQLIRQKGPFSRWRTLTMYISGESDQSTPWSTLDAFPNLKSLIVCNGTESSILRAIDSTITSQLEVLELRAWYPDLHADGMPDLTRSFIHISCLKLDRFSRNLDTTFLPANIINLQLNAAGVHRFPHILTYRLNVCMFFKSSVINLGNMTTLIVSGALRIACQVILPALQQLTLETISMETNGRIEAPALNMLHLKPSPGLRRGINYALSQMDNHLQCPGYLLSPNGSIIADSYLPSTTVLDVLAKSPKVTQAILRFNDWAVTQMVLERLIGLGVQPDSDAVENENLCPRLTELRLDFGWSLSTTSESKPWLIDRLKARRGTGILPPMSIYVGWKGEGTYVLLTGE